MSCPAVPCPPAPPDAEARFSLASPTPSDCWSALLYYNTQQTYVDSCPEGSPTAPISVTVLANLYTSTVSQDDADNEALAAAQEEAEALRELTPCQEASEGFILGEDGDFLITEDGSFLITE